MLILLKRQNSIPINLFIKLNSISLDEITNFRYLGSLRIATAKERLLKKILNAKLQKG